MPSTCFYHGGINFSAQRKNEPIVEVPDFEWPGWVILCGEGDLSVADMESANRTDSIDHMIETLARRRFSIPIRGRELT